MLIIDKGFFMWAVDEPDEVSRECFPFNDPIWSDDFWELGLFAN
jgi:hypothetical protein